MKLGCDSIINFLSHRIQPLMRILFPGGEKIITPMPLDMKLEKGEAEKHEPRSGTGTPGPTEYPSRPSGTPAAPLVPRGPSSPHVLASPHHDRSTDSPQARPRVFLAHTCNKTVILPEIMTISF